MGALDKRYQLLYALGAGGMGVVYRAQDRLTGQPVALKRVLLAPQNLTFNSRSAQDDTNSLLLALAQEFRLLASLRHPNIISVLDYGFDAERQPYFTMELLSLPQTLLQAGQGRPLAAQIDLLVQTLQTLAYLHRRSILHRDLKPGNVLVSGGRVRVLDFGLALKRDHAQNSDVSGTLLYLAPEVLEGAAPSEAADLYAVGMMAYELFTGQPPFQSTDPQQLLMEILEVDPDLTPLDGLTPVGARRTLPAILLRLLSKQPALRYPSAEAVIVDLYAVLNQPPPPESVAIRESFLQAATFVGREQELAQLTTALEQALQGQGSAWLIGGESGVGKSRLMDELRIQALVAGALVLRGQAVEGGGLPFQLWREALRRLVLTSELSDVEASILKEVVPEIGRLLERPVADLPPLPQAAGLERLGLTLIALLKRQTVPVVLLLEDLQWSVESLVLLQWVNRVVGEQPWLIIGNYRDDERPHLPDELGGMHLLKLPRLTPQETVALSTAMLGEAGQRAALLHLLQQQTEGNTFFIVEVLRALAEEVGRLSDIGQRTLPTNIIAQGMQALLQRRLARVPTWAQSLLKVAAVRGRQIDRQVLQQLDPTIDLEQWLQAGAEAAVLEVQDEQWRFAHDKLRAEVIAQIDATEKRQLYRRLAEAVETLYPQDRSHAEILLGYWRAAQEPTNALPYLLYVAREQIELGTNYQETHQLLLEGLAWSRTLLATNKQQSTLLKRLGDLHFREGDYAAAHRHYEAALQLAEQMDDPLIHASALHGLGMVAWRAGDHLQANQHMQASLALARQAGDQEQIISTLLMTAVLSSEQADYATAHDYYQQSMALAETLGDTMSVILCLINLGNDAQIQQNYPAALAALAKALTAAHTLQARRYIAHASSILGVIAQKQGDPAAALTHMTKAVAMDREIDDRFGLAYDLVTCGGIYLDLHAIAEARQCLREGLQIAQALGGAPTILHALLGFARFALHTGQVEQAANLCGLISAHPGLTPEMKQIDLAKLWTEVAAILPSEQLAAAHICGQPLDLQTTISRLLEQTE